MYTYTIALLLATAALIGCLYALAEAQDEAATSNEKQKFTNVYPMKEKKFADFLRWRFNRPDTPDPESYDFRLAENDPQFLQKNRTVNTFTWVGHATALVQINGMNILTDPIFSDRSSPVSWAGPKRTVQPGLALADLPEIDVVVISHDHYDSLDHVSIKALIKRPGETLFAVPMGLKKWFTKRGARNVVELGWWDTHKHLTAEVTAVPARHWSKRSFFGRNRTLWAGWIIRVEGFTFYFVGDSGYSPIFSEIGQRFGPIDLAAIPIGAYEPRWFMKDSHINPSEAVMVHMDVMSRLSIAIHWGTFVLTDERLDEPPVVLKQELEKAGIAHSAFRVLQHGQTIHIGNSTAK